MILDHPLCCETVRLHKRMAVSFDPVCQLCLQVHHLLARSLNLVSHHLASLGLVVAWVANTGERVDVKVLLGPGAVLAQFLVAVLHLFQESLGRNHVHLDVGSRFVAKLALVANPVRAVDNVLAVTVLPPKTHRGRSNHPPHLRILGTHLGLDKLGRNRTEHVGLHDAQCIVQAESRTSLQLENVPIPSPTEDVTHIMLRLKHTLRLLVKRSTRHFLNSLVLLKFSGFA